MPSKSQKTLLSFPIKFYATCLYHLVFIVLSIIASFQLAKEGEYGLKLTLFLMVFVNGLFRLYLTIKNNKEKTV